MIVRSIVIASFLVIGFSPQAFSQDITGGVDLYFGSGSTLFGFSGRYEAPINNQWSWMGTAGLGFGSGATLFTLQGGVKYTLPENVYLGDRKSVV